MFVAPVSCPNLTSPFPSLTNLTLPCLFVCIRTRQLCLPFIHALFLSYGVHVTCTPAHLSRMVSFLGVNAVLGLSRVHARG